MRLYVVPEWMRQRIPRHSIRVLERWVNHAESLSGFYWCLLAGDVWGAAEQADDENMATLGYMLKLIVEDFPGDSFGSPEKLKAWRGWANIPWDEDEDGDEDDIEEDGFGEATDYPEKER